MIKYMIMEGQVYDDEDRLEHHVYDFELEGVVFSGYRLECELWCENVAKIN